MRHQRLLQPRLKLNHWNISARQVSKVNKDSLLIECVYKLLHWAAANQTKPTALPFIYTMNICLFDFPTHKSDMVSLKIMNYCLETMSTALQHDCWFPATWDSEVLSNASTAEGRPRKHNPSFPQKVIHQASRDSQLNFHVKGFQWKLGKWKNVLNEKFVVLLSVISNCI